MEIRAKHGEIAAEAADLLILPMMQGVAELTGEAGAVDAALGGALRAVLAMGDFGGKAGETSVLYTQGALPAVRVLLLGMGESAKVNRSAVRDAAATAVRKARELGARTCTAVLPGVTPGDLGPQDTAEAVAEGMHLGLYRFPGNKSQPPKDWKPDPGVLTILEASVDRLPVILAGITQGEAIAQGVILARDLVSTPANLMTPAVLADRAAALAQETGLQIQVLGKDEIRALGMGIFMAVAEESEQPPRFIILEHNAGRADLPSVVLVGKGVTFDSGGISLKPGDEMWLMKSDMSGAAAVIATLGVAARRQIPLHVIGLAPCAENMPGGRAQKPGDVYMGMSGKTMEVISTDAEGRMLLADALAYAGRFSPAAVVDIATLTGAQMIALGPHAAAVFSNDEDLAGRLLRAAEASGERLWRLPLYDEYLEAIKSQVADVKNTGGRYGGVGTSAKFIEHFTEGYPWAHIDMASMAWSDEDKPARPKGATGYGVRLLFELLAAWGQETS